MSRASSSSSSSESSSSEGDNDDEVVLALEDRLDDLEEQLDSFKRKYDDAEVEAQELEEELDTVKRKCIEADARVDELEDELDTAKRKHEDEVEELGDELCKAVEKHDKLYFRVDTLKRERDEANELKREAEDRIDEAENEAEDLEVEAATLRAKLEDITRILERKSTALEDSRDAVRCAAKEIDTLWKTNKVCHLSRSRFVHYQPEISSVAVAAAAVLKGVGTAPSRARTNVQTRQALGRDLRPAQDKRRHWRHRVLLGILLHLLCAGTHRRLLSSAASSHQRHQEDDVHAAGSCAGQDRGQ